MKKALVVLLALACVSFAAFADGPTMSWAVGTWYGVGIQMPSSGTIVLPYDWSWEGAGASRLTAKYNAADGNAGFLARFEVDNAKAGGAILTAPAINQLYGFAKLFGGMATVRGGILDDYSVSTQIWNDWGNLDGSLGLALDLTPVAGLDIEGFLPIPTGPTPSANLLGPAGGKFASVGFQFKMPNLVAVQAGMVGNGSGYFGAQFLGMSALTAGAEGQVVIAGGTTAMTFLEQVAYAAGALTVGARIGESLPTSSTFNWGAEPYVTYKVNDNLSANVVVNVYSDPGQSWLASGGPLVGSATATTNFGGGLYLIWGQSGMSVTVGDYYCAATGSPGNSIFINADLSL